MADLLDVRTDDAFTSITLDDGKVNVCSPSMLGALHAALDGAVPRGRPVVLAGRPGIFSAGFDLEILRRGDAETRTMVRAGFELAYRLLSLPVPVVVACTGHAIAMGVFLVLSGDHRVGAAGRYRIGANEVAIGIPMPDFGIEICRQRLTPAALSRAVINAEMFDPDGAVAAGFLDTVVPASEVVDMACSIARGLGAFDADVHATTKLRVRAGALAAIRAAIESDSERWNAPTRTDA